MGTFAWKNKLKFTYKHSAIVFIPRVSLSQLANKLTDRVQKTVNVPLLDFNYLKPLATYHICCCIISTKNFYLCIV